MNLTDKQKALVEKARAGPVCVFGKDMTTARLLEKKGIGHITSNPGAAYSGRQTCQYRAAGGYYIGDGWKWDQDTRSFKRVESHE